MATGTRNRLSYVRILVRLRLVTLFGFSPLDCPWFYWGRYRRLG